MSICRCIGWWQQEGYGRQAMQELQIEFADSRIRGTGVDMIASFTLSGAVRVDGAVEMIKQYIDRHTVLYIGQYDGEGTFYGSWDIDGYRGQWSIKVLAPDGPARAEFSDVAPEMPRD